MEFWQAWREVGLLPHQVLIWLKSRAVLTYSHFMWNYEPMMYVGWKEGHMPRSKPPAEIRAVWEIASTIEDGASGIHPTQKPVETIKRPIAYHSKPGGLLYGALRGLRHGPHRRRADGPHLLRHGALAGLRRCVPCQASWRLSARIGVALGGARGGVAVVREPRAV